MWPAEDSDTSTFSQIPAPPPPKVKPVEVGAHWHNPIAGPKDAWPSFLHQAMTQAAHGGCVTMARQRSPHYASRPSVAMLLIVVSTIAGGGHQAAAQPFVSGDIAYVYSSSKQFLPGPSALLVTNSNGQAAGSVPRTVNGNYIIDAVPSQSG